MSPRFLVVVTGCFLCFVLLSGLVLVLGGPARGGIVTFVGVQGLGLAAFLRAALLAAVPQTDPFQRTVARRRRHRWTAAGLLIGAITTTVGLFLALEPLLAAVACVLTVGSLALLVRALDSYADRTARRHPVDAVRPGDEDRLAPEVMRATLLRRATQGLVAGALAAVVVAPLVGYLGSGAVVGIVAGIVTLVAVSSIVLGFGSFGLSWAAGRRLSALMSEDPARMKRLRTAVLRRRTTGLDEADRRDARSWARQAEPAFLMQLLSQLPVLVLVPGLQTVQLVIDPEDLFRRWLVGVMLVVMVPAYALMVVQWRRVRAVAGSSHDSVGDCT